ncbi:Predicted metalloprotease, contains C-terminal PDZ domain [Psychroflexus salarius]|uniref:Predicted metalloprotease, contains C-terminal PDZ domain n=1 Tax=Psychroflexus salarius TaxID=1155689 RepID=A0A1M4W5I2_9FLAO|nr:peptidase M61 [Psychroflexus salarius]SHE76410.1 Predicted metalloprotease, contains C-terminal PDZ domain [Psychroflexus salarius]
MKKISLLVLSSLILVACNIKPKQEKSGVSISLDLVNIDNDQVKVVHDPSVISTETTTFYIPKTIPGTYAINNYGQFVEDFSAISYDGESLPVKQLNQNSWEISNAKELDKVQYLVNDTYDIEGEGDVFSPAGTNIVADEHFMLNLHGFVGYFEGMQEEVHQLEVKRPNDLVASTSLPVASQLNEVNYTTDEFVTNRYFGIIDNPIMYAKPDTTSFDIQGMQVELSIYSPNKTYSTNDLKPALEEMIQAQKAFLGDIDNTPVYSILLYLSDMEATDARGFGALEHHTSTTVVLPETMPLEQLKQTMTDVVSHEFFHIITPLNIHSNEVHYFGYNDPKMSKHLWMYEGVTEYFANLFQVNQGLISEQEFYNRINDKISTAASFDRTMPFTEMSENILEKEYKDSYYNVYQKGALIGMTLDIKLRELSNGEMGILDLMKKLISKYGKEQPFNDDELFDDIVAMTYPEIEDYFDTYISGTTPLDFELFFDKVGLEQTTDMANTGYFLNGQTPFINVNQSTKEVFFRTSYPMNTFFNDLGVEPGDIIKSINGTTYNLDNIRNLIMNSMGWKEGDDFKMTVIRDGEELTFESKLEQPKIEKSTLKAKDLELSSNAYQLRQSWLKS